MKYCYGTSKGEFVIVPLEAGEGEVELKIGGKRCLKFPNAQAAARAVADHKTSYVHWDVAKDLQASADLADWDTSP